jgi:hypothetical protein
MPSLRKHIKELENIKEKNSKTGRRHSLDPEIVLREESVGSFREVLTRNASTRIGELENYECKLRIRLAAVLNILKMHPYKLK